MVHNEIYLLMKASLIIVGLLFILLLYLVTRKAIENNRRNRIEVVKEEMNQWLYQYLIEGNLIRALKPDTFVKKVALEELLVRYTEILEGDVEKSRISILADQHLKNYYQRNLKSLIWSQRMNALYHIEGFELKSLIKEVIDKLENVRSSHEEVLLSLRILALFGYQHIFRLLQAKWDKLTEFDYRSILFRLNIDLLGQFISGFRQCPEQLKYAILEVISTKKEPKYSLFLETTFTKGEGELRIRALKAITSMGFVLKIDPYLTLSNSNVWQERMMAAKLFGNSQEKETIPYLTRMLSDRNWWVRFQAGQAIMMFPNGYEILHGIHNASEDSFARDMAWEWMNKGAI